MKGEGGETVLAAKFAGVSLIGFATDAALLFLGTSVGLEAAWARLISLAAAMQVTFAINALFVFRSQDRSQWMRQWAHYMLTNGFGNFCNYWIFVTLVSTHWRIVSNHFFALAVGAFCAWLMNYAFARFIVFRERKPAAARPLTDPLPADANDR